MQRSVLYVEDDASDIFFMQRAFRKAKLADQLFIVEDGDDAIDYLAGEGAFTNRREYPLPRIVLLDLSAPRLSGFHVLKWIRGRSALRSLPVIVFTCSNLEQDRRHALALGADGFIRKPTSADLFFEVVDGVLRQWLQPPPQAKA